MDQSQDRRAIAALKAIVKTMMPEFYLLQSVGLPKQNFVESLKRGEPIAMAIANEFTGSEIDDAFGWPKMGSEGGEAELRAMPITPFLNENQTDRLRAFVTATHLGNEAGEAGMPGCEYS